MFKYLWRTAQDEALWAAAAADSSNLDLVRALAVLCVVFHHLCNALGIGTDLTWLVGHMGVLIFFVHTSLVLMMSLERSVVKLPAHLLIADFYIRRIFRIYPLAMLCVTVAFVELVPSRAEPWPWPTFLSNLALTMNLTYSTPMWSVLWTLPLEVQMYLALPIIFLLLRGRSLWWAAAGWGLSVVAALSYTRVSSRLDVAMYAPCFFAGVVAWRLMRTRQPRFSGAWWPLAFVASWSVFLVAPRSDPQYYRWVFGLALGSLIPLFSNLTFSPVVHASRIVARYSYGIYLSHLPIILFAVTFDGWQRWLLLLGLGTLVPVAMYHLIEQPMIDVGRSIAAKVTAKVRIGREPRPATDRVVPDHQFDAATDTPKPAATTAGRVIV